jgi:hypothetical protein
MRADPTIAPRTAAAAPPLAWILLLAAGAILAPAEATAQESANFWDPSDPRIGLAAGEQRAQVRRGGGAGLLDLVGHHPVVGRLAHRPEDAHRGVAQVLAGRNACTCRSESQKGRSRRGCKTHGWIDHSWIGKKRSGQWASPGEQCSACYFL